MKKSLKLPEKLLLKSAACWTPTHVEPTYGWPGQFTIVWRAPDFHGKIGAFIKSKTRPSKKQIGDALKRELLTRFRSPLRCDAKRVAYSYLEAKGETIPVDSILVAAKLATDALYDLDAKIAGDFFSSDPPKLFTASSHGWILGEIAEIRCAVAAMRSALESREGDR
jgi:hypothetical protein